jgi:hypothetical protein
MFFSFLIRLFKKNGTVFGLSQGIFHVLIYCENLFSKRSRTPYQDE